MSKDVFRPARRTLLAAGAGSVLAACTSSAGDKPPSPSGPPSQDAATTRRLKKLEREHDARLGVFAHNTGTGTTVVHRAGERFPMCSTFKPLAAAAVMKARDGGGGSSLDERIRYSRSDLVEHSPVTGTRAHLAGGMTLRELCDAAVRYSDNTAANLLLRELGGPTAVTRFCRSLGDEVTRLDRWETELNSAEPGNVKDTTSPRAIGRTYMRLILGDTLGGAGRRRLADWLKRNTTGEESLRAGLPEGWSVGEKTGAGGYGTHNDVGVAWTAHGREPVVLAVLTTKKSAGAEPDRALIAKTARILAPALT
ncbi:class A beta-lactamase [Streptomyces sp. WMMB 322]|uniref:class A beta-lactamase n=1 Tax=Streptomyces sp. WMMB 322 TaxID=1286821 RepID=UPI0006E17B95|nr:class A beta-lactamase [Streptomyces sp. WMMB 322]SCK48896.1 beta-lactamase class A [Streptomyces sp. WMMB 322]